mmetsp:Transcript_23159/g.58720  ORF Transcript_23159/g.58720 Transcript_23159/m.58720 type:complete len:208 (-) Transcript_23159:391-1014(-)
MQPRIARSTPRLVFNYFFYLHYGSLSLSILMYAIFLIESVLGVEDGLASNTLLVLLASLYFGLVGRDVSKFCAETLLNQAVGFERDRDVEQSVHKGSNCGICGCAVVSTELGEGNSQSVDLFDKTIVLRCNHKFHSSCIRGWALLGKMSMCPLCKEEVDMRAVLVQPWEFRSQLWGSLLDAVKYLTVWNPIIIVVVQVVVHLLGPSE